MHERLTVPVALQDTSNSAWEQVCSSSQNVLCGDTTWCTRSLLVTYIKSSEAGIVLRDIEGQSRHVILRICETTHRWQRGAGERYSSTGNGFGTSWHLYIGAADADADAADDDDDDDDDGDGDGDEDEDEDDEDDEDNHGHASRCKWKKKTSISRSIRTKSLQSRQPG